VNWIRKIRNIYGSWQGYGACLSCGNSWSWVESVSIIYKKAYGDVHGAGFSPICCACFDTWGDSEILGYCYGVYQMRNREYAWDDIVEALIESIRQEKIKRLEAHKEIAK